MMSGRSQSISGFGTETNSLSLLGIPQPLCRPAPDLFIIVFYVQLLVSHPVAAAHVLWINETCAYVNVKCKVTIRLTSARTNRQVHDEGNYSDLRFS